MPNSYSNPVQEKVISTLRSALPGLRSMEDDFYIIGGSALILAGIEIGDTKDIDILTTPRNVQILRKVWSEKLDQDFILGESELFRSEFARFIFPEMIVEGLGNLEICKNGIWSLVNVDDFTTVEVEGMKIKIPTISDIVRILELFGREKDKERVKIINSHF